MREYVTVVRRLLEMETVTYAGKVVKVQDLRLDLGEGAHRQAIDVPIYIGATGPKMLELAWEIALQKDISLYQEERNVAGGSINWRITGQDARAKMHRLYPCH